MTKLKIPVAVHLFLLRNGEVLLLRRLNTGFMDGKYSVVAGHIDGGETVSQAMIREAEEEAGIVISEEDLHTVQVMHRNSDTERIDYFFVADKWSGDVRNAEPDKCDDLSWFPVSTLPQNMVPYVKYAFEQYQKGQQFTVYGW